ncbi:PQQ-binding-like beta-propeller repeat protein [Dactylosporangium sp. NPDC000521]|uniref:caspase, EACC1-associated type n=1 Tax=Dactylosporangium sp. NPDC000521 TaxID=3363975 RepID=UPI00368F2593
MILADPLASRAVLIGVGAYRKPELPDLPAVANNLRSLTGILTDPLRCGLPGESIAVVSDPRTPVAVAQAVAKAADEATDALLVYYAGHGMRAGRRGELYLAVAESSVEFSDVDCLPYQRLRDTVLDSPAAVKIVILDCCFSGAALDGMGGGPAGQVVIDGAYVLTATSATRLAMAPIGAEHTAFTGELVGLLTEGLPGGGEYLSLDTVYHHVSQRLRSKGLPRAEAAARNTSGTFALARNVAATTSTTSTAPESVRQSSIVDESPITEVPAAPPAAVVAWTVERVGPVVRGIRRPIPPLVATHQLNTWAIALDSKSREPAAFAPPVAGDTLLMAGTDHRLYGLDALTGAVRWAFAEPERTLVRPVLAAGSRVLVCDDGGQVHCLDSGTGERQWRHPIAGSAARTALVTDGANVYVAVHGDLAAPDLTAVDLATGAERWRHRVDARLPVLAPGGHVVVRRERRVVSLAADSGEDRWTRELVGGPVAAIADADGVVVGTDAGRVAGLAPASGEIRWQVVPKPRPLVARFASEKPLEWVLAAADGVVVAARPEGKRVYGLDRETGETGWSMRANGWGGPFSAITIAGGVAYFATRDLHAVEAATGRVRWTLRTGYYPGAVTMAGDVACFGVGAHLYAVDTATGTVRWRHLVGRWHATAPTLTNGLVAFVDDAAAATALRL